MAYAPRSSNRIWHMRPDLCQQTHKTSRLAWPRNICKRNALSTKRPATKRPAMKGQDQFDHLHYKCCQFYYPMVYAPRSSQRMMYKFGKELNQAILNHLLRCDGTRHKTISRYCPFKLYTIATTKEILKQGGGGQLSISVRIEDHTNRNWLTKVRGKTVEERLNLPFYLVSHCLKIFIDNNNGRYG